MTASTSKQLSEDSLWLVRTSANRLSGPFLMKNLKVKILASEVGHQDEVCPSGGYWFALHERMEVDRWLGIEVPKAKRALASQDVTKGGWSDDEQTATDTELKPGALNQVPVQSGASVVVTPHVAVAPPAVSKQPKLQNADESERTKKIRWFIKEFGFVALVAVSLLIFAGFRLARLN